MARVCILNLNTRESCTVQFDLRQCGENHISHCVTKLCSARTLVRVVDICTVACTMHAYIQHLYYTVQPTVSCTHTYTSYVCPSIETFCVVKYYHSFRVDRTRYYTLTGNYLFGFYFDRTEIKLSLSRKRLYLFLFITFVILYFM